MSGYRAGLAATAFVVGLVAAMVLFEAATWEGQVSGCVAAADCSCEAFREDGFAVQPANTASNLGFAAVGLAILWEVGRRRRTEAALAIAYGLVVVGLGVGSGLFHGTLTSWGGWADLTSMYLFICLYIAVNLADRYQWRPGRALALFAIASGGLALLQVPLDQGAGRFVFGGLVGVALVTEWTVRHRSRDRRWLAAGAGVLASSFAVWNLSRTSAPWCEPSSSLQGHALWHLGAAVTVGLLFLYLRPALVKD